MADDDERKAIVYAGERCDLLLKFKSTVDGLLANGSHVTWSTYGGLGRISENMEQILMHGCRVIVQGTNGTKLGVSELLNCLKVEHDGNFDEDDDDNDDNENLNQWIQKSLLKHVLSVSLAKFVRSKTHLKHYYHKFAFLRSQQHFQALQHCLRAIEEDNPLLPTTIDYKLLNKRRYIDEYHKSHNEMGSLLYVEDSSSEYSSANDDSVQVNGLPETQQTTDTENEHKDTKNSNESDFFSINEDDQDTFFTPKVSSLPRKKKAISKFDEKILVDAALSAAMEPVDVRSEIRWFEGDVIEPTIYGETSMAKQKKFASLDDGNTTTLIKRSNESLSSTSTIDSLPFEPKNTFNKNNEGRLSEHDKKKRIGHSRSKSDQFRRFRPFGSNKETMRKPDSNISNDGDATLSSSLPTNHDVTEFYGGRLGSPISSRKHQPAILGYLSSRQYDTCHELDKENAHFSISEALIGAIEQMKCEAFHDSDKNEDDDDEDEDDEEILRLRAQIKKKKEAKKQLVQKEIHETNTRSSSAATKSEETSVSSGSPHSNYSREPAKSVDSDYNSSGDFPVSESNKIGAIVEPTKAVAFVSSLDTSSMEVSTSPISAEQVALSLLQKVASRKNLKSSDLQWMVSEQDVPQSLLPLPTAVPISPDDELYETTGSFTRKTSLSCRLRGNSEWAPPRQQIIFNIPATPKRKEAMSKQGFRCAGCGMRIDPGYVKRFRYCNYLGKYFCNTCHSSKLTVIPARIIQRWDFKEYEASNFARDLLTRVHNDALFNVLAINKSLYKRVKSIDEVKYLRLRLRHLVPFLRTCRFGEKLMENINKLQSYVINDIHLYSINDFLEVRSGVFRERLDKLVKQALDHVTACQLCLAKGFVCEYCRNGDDIIYPFEVKRCTQCPDCSTCYHRECFVKGKCPRCERILLRKTAVEVFNIETDDAL